MNARNCDLCGAPIPYTDWNVCESCHPLNAIGNERLWETAKAAVGRVRMGTDMITCGMCGKPIESNVYVRLNDKYVHRECHMAGLKAERDAARASEKAMGEELRRVHEDLAAVGEALRDILSHAWVECNAGRDVRMLNPVPVDRVARWRAALAPPAESRVCLGCGHFKHSNPCNCGCTMRPISPSDVYSSSRAGDMSECQSNMYSSRMCQRGTKSCTVDHAAREGK